MIPDKVHGLPMKFPRPGHRPHMRSRFSPRSCTCAVSIKSVYKMIIESAINAMKHSGPGQTERNYEEVMHQYLGQHNIFVDTQRKIFHPRVNDQSEPTLCGIVDLFLNGPIIVELKANQKTITQQHVSQVMRYHEVMQKTHKPFYVNQKAVSFIINFTDVSNVPLVQIWNTKTQKIETFYTDDHPFYNQHN